MEKVCPLVRTFEWPCVLWSNQPPPHPQSHWKTLSQEQKKCSKVGGAPGDPEGGLGRKGEAVVGGRERGKGGFEGLEEGVC